MRMLMAVVLASLAGAASARLAGQDPKAAPVVKASRFELVDDAGRTRAVLGVSKGGSPEFDLRDVKGRPRALLLLDADSLPVFFFKDAEVVTRAKWELDAQGAAKLSFLDADLTPRVEIETEKPELRVSNSKGQPIWKAP